MPRREVKTAPCPDCDGTVRIPIVYSDDPATGEESQFEIDRGAQCSNQANGDHHAFSDDEFKRLILEG
jgi:hypothetical protein